MTLTIIIGVDCTAQPKNTGLVRTVRDAEKIVETDLDSAVNSQFVNQRRVTRLVRQRLEQRIHFHVDQP